MHIILKHHAHVYAFINIPRSIDTITMLESNPKHPVRVVGIMLCLTQMSKAKYVSHGIKLLLCTFHDSQYTYTSHSIV